MMTFSSRICCFCQVYFTKSLSISRFYASSYLSNSVPSNTAGKSYESFEETLHKPPIQPPDPKRLRVGIIGMPNVGKSTLINALTGKKLMATSSRIDTTRENILAVMTDENVQIEFQDTPGIHNRIKSKKIKGVFQNTLPSHGMAQADVAMVVVDLSGRRTSKGFLQPELLLHLLKHRDIPTVLILNKVDRLSDKASVLPLIRELTAGMLDGVPIQNEISQKEIEPISLPQIESGVFHAIDAFETFENAADINLANKTEAKVLKQLRHFRGWPHFKEVFVVSALRRKNTDKLKVYLKSKALSEPWKYHADMTTDASPYDLVKDMTRSTMLENLNDEVPYLTEIVISNWEENNKVINIFIDLICQNNRHVRIVERATNVLAFGTRKRLREVFPINVEVYFTVYSSAEY